MRYVFNTEDGYAMLGEFVGHDEGVVLYKSGYNAAVKHAPEDCVVVREVTRAEVIAEVERLAANLKSGAEWAGGDDTVAFNSLLQTGIEIIEYAQVMGAALTVDQAYANLRRDQQERYIGVRAHSRQFEESDAAADDVAV